VLVPTIPTVLSLRTLAWLLEWADGRDEVPVLAALLSMVDRRKALHRRTCLWAARHPALFLSAQIPCASIVEQMAMRRMPLPVLAPSDAATAAAMAAWSELEPRAERNAGRWIPGEPNRKQLRREIEMVIRALEADEEAVIAPVDGMRQRELNDVASRPQSSQSVNVTKNSDSTATDDVAVFAHRFDTEQGDLQGHGCVLELRECSRRYFVAISRMSAGCGTAATATELQVDARWAVQILAGALSPLVALERRLGKAHVSLVALARESAGDRPLRRIESRRITPAPAADEQRPSSMAS